MRVAASVLLAGLGLATHARAQAPYWICVDAQLNKTVQDHPCAHAPEAPPSGPVTLAPAAVEEKSAAPRQRAARPQSAELDSTAWWTRRFERAQKAFEQAGGLRMLWRNPWLHLGAGLLVLLLVGRWGWRSGLPRLRARRVQRAASAQPDAYRLAFGQRLQAETPAPPPRRPELRPALPTRWTPELLRALTAAQFTQLCLRLWQLRGLRAQREPGGAGADAVILLRHPARADVLHGVVLARSSRDEALGAGAVRELLGLMSHHGCAYGALMTAGEFDTEARDFVRGKSMELKGWMSLMTELDALPDESRAALLTEILGAGGPAADAPREMLRP